MRWPWSKPVEQPEEQPEFVYAMDAIWKIKYLAKDFERVWLEQAIIVAKGRGSNKVEIFDVDVALAKAWNLWTLGFRKGEEY